MNIGLYQELAPQMMSQFRDSFGMDEFVAYPSKLQSFVFGVGNATTLMNSETALSESEVDQCLQRVLLGTLPKLSTELFPSCLCTRIKYSTALEKSIGEFKITPQFSKPKSDVAQLIMAIFEGNVTGAETLISKPVAFKENLTQDLVYELSLEFRQIPIAYQIVKSVTSEEPNEGVKDLLERYHKSTNLKTLQCMDLAKKKHHKAALRVAILLADVSQAVKTAELAEIDPDSKLFTDTEEGTDYSALGLAAKLGDLDMYDALNNLAVKMRSSHA